MKDRKQPARMVGSLRGSVKIIEDIMSTGVRWGADREGLRDGDSQDSNEPSEDELRDERR